jgi:hypothetical protein
LHTNFHMCTEKSHLCEFKTTTKFNNSNTDKTAIHLYIYAIADVARVKHCIRDHKILLQLLSCNSRINKTIELKSNKIISIYFSTKVKPLSKIIKQKYNKRLYLWITQSYTSFDKTLDLTIITSKILHSLHQTWKIKVNMYFLFYAAPNTHRMAAKKIYFWSSSAIYRFLIPKNINFIVKVNSIR